jgi:hypothetical protein
MNWIKDINKEGFAYIYKRISNFLSYPIWYMFSIITMIIATISLAFTIKTSIATGMYASFNNQLMIYIFLLIDMLMLHTSNGSGTYEFYLNKNAHSFVTMYNGKMIFNILIIISMIFVTIFNMRMCCELNIMNFLFYWIRNLIPTQGIIRLFAYTFDFYYLSIHNRKSMAEYRKGDVLRFVTMDKKVEVYVYEKDRDVLISTFTI